MTQLNHTIIRMKELVVRVGLSRKQIYRLIDGGQFPVPIALSTRAKGWVVSEVDDWIERRMENR